MKRIGEEIERELARSGGRDVVPLAAITAAWPEVVGQTVAQRAWPLRLGRDRTLHVAAASATWAHELDLLQGEILDKLRARLGAETPARLRFAVGPIPEPPVPLEPKGTTAEELADLPPEIESEATSAASEIDDPELRELVARAARASLFRARSGRHFW